MHRSSLALFFVPLLTAPLAAQVGYSTGFETFVASPAGTGCAGQDGFYIPAVAGTIDANIFTYAGNVLGIPANPNGGANFYGGHSIGGSSRSQRNVTVPANCRIYVQFDICCAYLGIAAAPPNNIGSFSYQPSATNVYVNLLARWPTGATTPPATWNADLVVGPTAAGTATVLADPNFQGLAVGVWHSWGCTADLATGQYTEFRITNGVTNVTTVFTPAPGSMPLPNQGMPLPTDFRLFCGGADDVFAVDNLVITYGAKYSGYGTGCSGSLGVPTLAAASGSLPKLGNTLMVDIGNLPLNVAIMATGFSNTTALGGALPLPYPLAGFGFPGCDLLADPVATTFLVGAGGTATWSLAIPGSSIYLGFDFYNQGFSLDSAAPGLAVSNGGHGCIGQ